MGIVIALGLSALVTVAQIDKSAAVVKHDVVARSGEVRVGDLIVAGGDDLPRSVLDQVVARLPRDGRVLNLAAEDVASLVRRRVPGLRVLVSPGSKVRIQTSLAQVPARAAPDCFAAAGAIGVGQILSAEDLVGTECLVGSPLPMVRYDRGGMIVALEAVPSGGYLGRLAMPSSGAIGRGTSLVLRSASGPVTVEREVTAVQPGHSGKRVFVRDSEGQVFAAPLALAAKAGVR